MITGEAIADEQDPQRFGGDRATAENDQQCWRLEIERRSRELRVLDQASWIVRLWRSFLPFCDVRFWPATSVHPISLATVSWLKTFN